MTERARRGPRRLSPIAQRTRQLLIAGLVGGHLALAVCVIAFGIVAGAAAAASAALAGIVAIAFFTIGHAVQLLVADARPGQVLLAALISYAGRTGALGVLLAVVLANRDRLVGMDPTAVIIATLAVVVGWLSGEIRAFSRLRIPVFDETDRPGGGAS